MLKREWIRRIGIKILKICKKILTICKRIIIWGCLTILLLILMLILLVKYLNQKEEKFLDEAEYVVVILSKTEDGRYQVEREMTESSAGDWGYSEKQQTIVFEDRQGNIIEKSMETGKETVLIIPDLEKLKHAYLKEEYGEDEEKAEKWRPYLFTGGNYLPNGYDISFRLGHQLYIWNRNKNEVEEVNVPLEPPNFGALYYHWMENGDLIFIYKHPSKRGNAVARWYREEGRIEDICYNMEVFLVDEEKEVLYGIYEEINYNINLGYYSNFSLIEKNIETGAERMIIENYTSGNTNRLAHEGDKLFYVDEGIWITKQEVMCVDIHTGISESIYRTDNRIVGIIVQ